MSLKASEFECPIHGRFDALVPRADDPDEWPCPALMLAFDLASPEPPAAVPCSLRSPWRISAPLFKPQYGAVRTGKADERPPWALDTTPLADGMSPSEWKAKQDRVDRENRIKQNRARLA